MSEVALYGVMSKVAIYSLDMLGAACGWSVILLSDIYQHDLKRSKPVS